MKKLMLVALVVILLPSVLGAQGIKQGDPAFYFNFPGGTINVIKGETWGDHLYAGNFYWSNDPEVYSCVDPVDTFAVVTGDDLGWPITNVFDDGTDTDAEGVCYILDDLVALEWYFNVAVCITVPCEALVGDLNTFSVQMAYCDEGVAAPDSGDCEDPNVRSGPVDCYSTITQDFEVTASPPALYILQDTLYFVEQGQTAAYIPFSICNGDACAPPTDYDYVITSLGYVGAALNQTGTASGVSGGTCQDVYGIVDAGVTAVCTYDTLTIVVWDAGVGSIYDTCVQAIHVVEPVPVPLFTAPVVTILVLAMILAAAVIMKRHAVSKA